MWLDRQALVIGQEGCDALRRSRVAVIGIGGVGGAAAEALCRCGIGDLLVMDHDRVDDTNRNRQLLATAETVGRRKVAVLGERLRTINPDCRVEERDCFLDADTLPELLAWRPDYVVDCIDTVTSKLALIEGCQGAGVPLVCCLGTGNRLDPTQFHLGDLYDTGGCGDPLARVMRSLCRKRGIERLEVVYSTAPVIRPPEGFAGDSPQGRHSPGSVSFVPPVAGYTLASLVVRRLLGLPC
ncbi:tRNA threonylcarbamoyladenosine dehydratase [Bittarella massiliensis]|uniref:tRNA threonylcarbamoyladenosine dehydratase n=1 Tax=Bittarella massiliensis (ex Durand et al. 2017) TaxID=1720313 RepID=UPI00163CF4B7|nr:tRNA threonylcarbamoyladenosine dehydratase [Bittarella massiliensis (ex Durand et al. 2017)]MBC2871990.1 tRNA threonylcarbamoyladenosine dehydratase [Bittarella massiliensis (ex Durand et al. 2017)]